MSRTALEILCCAADAKSPVFTHDELVEWPEAARRPLLELRLLRQVEAARHVVCDACADGHVEEAIRLVSPDGAARFFIRCPESGRVEVSPERLNQWTVDFQAIAAQVSAAIGAAGGVHELIPSRFWHLGRIPLAGRSRQFVLARGLVWPDAGTAVGQASIHRGAVLLVMGILPDEGVWNGKSPLVFPLVDVVSLNGNGMAADITRVAEAVAAREGPEPAKKKPRKRASRAAAIDAIKQLLREHLRAARDHAYSAVEQSREPALLPRPSQRRIAAQLGLHVSSISRAIKDPSDREIAILWGVASDLEQVMKFR